MYSVKTSSGDGWYSTMAYILVLAPWVVLPACGACSVSEPRFDKVMESEGLTEARPAGYDWFECGTGDVWVSSFTAKRDDKRVEGTACCGWIKGCTVRWH